MIFMTGGTGFIGSHLIADLIAQGHDVTCLARSDSAAEALAGKGVRVVRGDVSSPETLYGKLEKEDFVIHLVGIIEERKGLTFRSVHVDGTSNLVAEAQRAGAGHFLFLSAIGADLNSWSSYLKTKAEAEEIVKASGLSWTVIRSSIVVGPWDGFTKKLVDMLNMSPVIPVPGDGKARFQPIYVKDLVKCIERVIADPRRYVDTLEIGGPQQLTFKEIAETLSSALGHRRPSFRIPMGFMKLAASVFGNLPVSAPITHDQLRLLETDNVCDLDAVEKMFGFTPMAYADALKDFI